MTRCYGVAFDRMSRAVYLILGSLIPMNLAIIFIESLIMFYSAASPSDNAKRIASKRMPWSELFLFMCFVTSVFVKIMQI